MKIKKKRDREKKKVGLARSHLGGGGSRPLANSFLLFCYFGCETVPFFIPSFFFFINKKKGPRYPLCFTMFHMFHIGKGTVGKRSKKG
jgi:hypothetical protein